MTRSTTGPGEVGVSAGESRAASLVPGSPGVRSYAARGGRLTRAQRRAIETLWPVWGIDEWQPLALHRAFRRRAPVFVEVGFGMGDALLEMAARHPERNYLGIEVYPPGIGRTLQAIEARSLENIRLIRADAVAVLGWLEAQSLDGLLVFFPDPWPKKRHHKRRLIQPAFIELAAARLKTGGRLELATDWVPYADEMLAVVEAHGGFVNLAGRGNFAPRPESRPNTKFERRGLKLGYSIRDLVFERDFSGT